MRNFQVAKTKDRMESEQHSVWLNAIIVIGMAFIVTGLLLLMSSTPENIGSLFVDNPLRIWALFAIALVILFTIHVFVGNMERDGRTAQKYLLIVYVSILVTIGLTLVCYEFINPYIAPITLLPVIITVFVGRRIAILCDGLFSALLLLAYMLVGPTGNMLSSEVMSGIVSMLVGYFVVFFLNRTSNRTRYLVTGVGIALLSMPLAFASELLVQLSSGTVDPLAMQGVLMESVKATLWSFAGNMLAVSIFLVTLPIFESVFKICTDFKLSEYCNFRVKVLRELAEIAPGTFNHCMMVGVLAESCAIAIGENPQLARTCAYYHDVGKTRSPEFFAENQHGGVNPHDDIIPEVSAKKITSHAQYGYDMLKKRGYPEEIAKVCLEHHGTMPVSYFYRKADKISDGNAELAKFSYPGPKPTSKVAAIIMLADASEAAARAAVHKVPLDVIVGNIFKERMDYGQFDDCPITFDDLHKIKMTIIEVLDGIHHNRVSYTPKI
ncbi:MAG: HDIG domain-containing protein [Clostridia bacterium]|nr:HDIG domain-containing protein [Clostridia bacterium]